MNTEELEEFGIEGNVIDETTQDGERPIFKPLNLITEHCERMWNDGLNLSNSNFGIDDYICKGFGNYFRKCLIHPGID